MLTKVTKSQALMRTSCRSMPVGPMLMVAAGEGADGASLHAARVRANRTVKQRGTRWLRGLDIETV